MASLAVLAGLAATVAPAAASSTRPPPPIPAVESGLLPWQLPAALSREVALPGTGSQLVVLGGLTAASATTPAVSGFQTPAGTPSSLGTLTSPVHDAAGAVLGRHFVVFGGGASSTVATVQAFAPAPTGASATAVVTGQLPQPRSDATGVTIGTTAFIVGGYDGTNPDRSVLATTNGRTFTTVASLPVPVRYPAVAALGRTIFVFGGQAVGGAGQPVNVIQAVDPLGHRARVVGHLPEPLEGAAAMTVGGHIYVAGGVTSSAAGAALPPSNGTNLMGYAPPTSAGTTVATVWAFDPAHLRLLVAGSLLTPVANSAAVVTGNTAWLVGGETGGTPIASVQMLRPDLRFGTAGVAGAGSPYFGQKLLIADRGNDRLLVMNAAGQILWDYPSATMPPPPGPKGFYFPDDAFFIRHGTAIISNQEENETIVEIAYPSGKVLWTTGHPAVAGSSPGYLHEPDDAYLLKNGQISVADAQNCRILILNPDGSIAKQIGETGNCTHDPPNGVASPNGDTPLPNGDILVSEVTGSWITEYTQTGQVVWSVHVPIAYPSDPQPLGHDLYLMADYSTPGGIVEFNQAGQVLYHYADPAGPGMLNQPSLVEQVPSGAFMVNDDYRDRMAAIDPYTGALVWDYGNPDHPGTAPGSLNIPDGFDLLAANGTTPTHPWTG
ncbi:MAG TPA: PQQ-binding-like beta-propeller repeat protein [Acidimicrobiales bacterium]|nr:PQQ-binding-like beta-propeller repeat protein [Acidimicrobiales bacterium]